MRRARRDETIHGLCAEDRPRGFGGFLRSLLSGIPWSESAQGMETLSFAPPRGTLLRVHNANGKTRVVGEERSDVQVIACKRARAESSEEAARLLDEIRVSETQSNGALELEVEIPKKWNRHGSANLEIHVPRELRVEVGASNGKVTLEGLRGGAKARSSNGAVTVIDVVGAIDIFTSNAKVECSTTRGRLVARSSNGKIELEDHRGSVDASTSNGLISASIEEVGREGVLLATSNGRIALELPEKVDAELDIHVDNGVIRTHRDLGGASPQPTGRLRATLGAGGPLIKLRTSNGSISLK